MLAEMPDHLRQRGVGRTRRARAVQQAHRAAVAVAALEPLDARNTLGNARTTASLTLVAGPPPPSPAPSPRPPRLRWADALEKLSPTAARPEVVPRSILRSYMLQMNL